MARLSLLGILSLSALLLLSSHSYVHANPTQHAETAEIHRLVRKAARLTPNFQPKAQGISASDKGLALSSGDKSPAAVGQAVAAPQPPLDFGQLFKDIVPNNNYSAALDRACNAIHTQLPANEYYGRAPAGVSLAANYVTATGDYYNARQAANRPACVIFPTSAQDISSIVKNLRKYDVTYAVRGAGHSTGYNFTNEAGFSSTTGVLIDMNKMKAVSFDKATGIARWEPGQNWGELADSMAKYGAQVAGGRLAHVGSGLSLGGGLSWFSGQVGFASDTSVAFEMVLADGSIVTATPTNQYKDLWWAQKTGLNAFGIVTAVHSKTMPSPAGGKYFGGSVLYFTGDLEGVFGALANWYQTGADKCPKGFVLPAITDALVDSALTRLNVFEFFYDGTDPGNCFDEFRKFPTLLNNTAVQSYGDFLRNPITNTEFFFKGFNNALYSAVTDIPTKETLLKIYYAWTNSSQPVQGLFLQRALSFSPVTPNHLRQHKAAGGSALGVENETKGYLWPCYIDGSIPAIGALTDTRMFQASVTASQAVPPPAGRSLPLYLNYARVEQKPLLTFRQDSLQKYRQIKKKYDPNNFITTHTTGHVFY